MTTRPPTIAELPRLVANDPEPPAPAAKHTERRPDGVAVVQCTDGQFHVSRVRDGGTSYAIVTYSRAELEQLRVAADEALRGASR